MGNVQLYYCIAGLNYQMLYEKPEIKQNHSLAFFAPPPLLILILIFSNLDMSPLLGDIFNKLFVQSLKLWRESQEE